MGDALQLPTHADTLAQGRGEMLHQQLELVMKEQQQQKQQKQQQQGLQPREETQESNHQHWHEKQERKQERTQEGNKEGNKERKDGIPVLARNEQARPASPTAAWAFEALSGLSMADDDEINAHMAV